MSVVKPWMSLEPAPGLLPGGAKSQMEGLVPGLAFSSAMRLTWGPTGAAAGFPGGVTPPGGVDEFPLNGRHSCVWHVALPPGPQTPAAVVLVIVTFAPCSPPLTAMTALAAE